MRKFITERALKKLKADTGGGCSVCGDVPCVNVEGTYWLCGKCARERIQDSGPAFGVRLEQELLHRYHQCPATAAPDTILLAVCNAVAEVNKELRDERHEG